MTTGTGAALLLIFARLQAGMWIWADGFYLDGSQWFDAARTTVTLVGIIGLGGAAFLAYRKQRSTEATHLLEEANTLRNRYTTCAEQLGRDKPAIRLAGVYALASLADDWHTFGNHDERQVCIDLLCAYLRTDRASSPNHSTASAPHSASRPHIAGRKPLRLAPHPPQVDDQEREVRNAIVTVIRDHTQPSAGTKTWSECRFNLANAHLTHAHLTHARLSGANLSGANLSGANLSGANLSGANLSGANLSGANLSRANLSRAHLGVANLSGANLRGANLGGTGLDAANLSRAHLTGANLTDIIYYNPPVNWPDSVPLPPSRDLAQKS